MKYGNLRHFYSSIKHLHLPFKPRQPTIHYYHQQISNPIPPLNQNRDRNSIRRSQCSTFGIYREFSSEKEVSQPSPPLPKQQLPQEQPLSQYVTPPIKPLPLSSSSSSSSSSSPISWKSLTITLVVGFGVLSFYHYEKERLQSSVQPVISIGRANIGGSFSLIDKNGDRFDSSQLFNKYSLLYFGFTNCPDICPTELKKMEIALNQFKTENPNLPPITPIFISIDPRRDNPKRLTQYSEGYQPNMIWLTGSNEEISDITKKYRVYFSAPDSDSDDNDYLVDHSIFFYLIDRSGDCIEYFGKTMTADEVATKLGKIIKQDWKNKSQ